ncbi:T9SS type A sorting domain-containing protein [Chryseobacterium camelliae]|uniref:T9SS type A sorting domain-containing protein n=1 Tax=Chryseobacterium camelliae TaxID=1265445 RepID=A0ABY7QNS3_9FLAO|nr:T9SS type A sorting domain-containing protein [Chryseobacterium camelliae]WBV60824.1 T9SS type A sorting domain-containing protein [Chryseobacterium camelliae]
MRQIFILLSVIFSTYQVNGQTTFPYTRSWGTYVGGTGNLLFDEYKVESNVFQDSQNNIYTNSKTTMQNGYQSSYYNQFVLGGNNCDMSSSINLYHAVFGSSGMMIFAGYKGSAISTNNNFEILRGIDPQDNKYILKGYNGIISNLSTSGVWLTQNQNPSSNKTFTLSKYSPSGSLLWTTYLPKTLSVRGMMLRFDEESNIYLEGTTDESIPGLTTSGVFLENFVTYQNSATTGLNSYLVKLNSSGQKIWATYSPDIYDYEVHEGYIYTVSQYDATMPGNYTDSGTFQPSVPAQNIITKINSATGQKVWGTFYGTPILPNTYTGTGIYDIEVNSTGIYVSGQNENTNSPTYFATSGAFKPQMTGSGDLFLSKFDFTGNRVWGTYFGTNGYDLILGFSNLSVFGNKIIITGNQYGASDNISTPNAFLTTVPNTSSNWTNMYFAEFDDTGARLWSSYYGGPGTCFYGEYITPKFSSDGSFILYGTTGATSGIGTSNGAFPSMLNPAGQQPFGYIAKFVLKEQLSTSETTKTTDLILYDNPNNGNFYLKGDALEKQQASIKLLDMSGRLVAEQKLEKNKINFIQMKGRLSAGNYMFQVLSDQSEEIKVFKMTVQ